MKQRLRDHGRNHLPGGTDPTYTVTDMTLDVIIDGAGSPLDTGIKGDAVIDRPCTITAWTLLADVSGDAVVDVWKDSYAGAPPDVADSITGTSPPTLIGQVKARDTALDGWATAVDPGDVLRFNVDSASAVGRLTLALTLRPR